MPTYSPQKSDKVDWLNFRDKTVYFKWIDFLYNGVPVFRDTICVVDGGRCGLPAPEKIVPEVVVSRKAVNFFRTLEGISGGVSQFDDYLSRSKMQVVDIPWMS